MPSQPRLIFGLVAAERRLRRWIDARAGERGVSAAGAGVLFILAARDDAPIGELAETLDTSMSGMSGLISRLERAGLVSRSVDPDDRRSARIRITEAGALAVADGREGLRELNGILTDGFSADEIEVVDRWLTHVASSLR